MGGGGGGNIAESCKSFVNWNHQIKELCEYQPIHFGWNRVEKSISKHESNIRLAVTTAAAITFTATTTIAMTTTRKTKGNR